MRKLFLFCLLGSSSSYGYFFFAKLVLEIACHNLQRYQNSWATAPYALCFCSIKCKRDMVSAKILHSWPRVVGLDRRIIVQFQAEKSLQLACFVFPTKVMWQYSSNFVLFTCILFVGNILEKTKGQIPLRLSCVADALNLLYTAILRKVVGRNVYATMPKVLWDMINTLFLTL